MTPFVVRFGASGPRARAIRVAGEPDLPLALRQLGLPGRAPTLALIGGARRMSPQEIDRVRPLFEKAVIPTLAKVNGAIVDGGTDCGVMRLAGRAHAAQGATFPLVGVVSEALVALPDAVPTSDEQARLEPHHGHFVLAPGDSWGDESIWLDDVAAHLADDGGAVTLLVNGGEISRGDVRRSLASRRPVIVVEGSGRLADELAGAAARPPMLEVVALDAGPAALAAAIERLLQEPVHERA